MRRPRQRVDQWLVKQHRSLPEAAAHDREPPGAGEPYAQQAKLCIGPTDDHRGPLGQARFYRRLRRYAPDDGAWFDDGRENLALQAANIEYAVRPVALSEVEHPRARAQ